MRITKRVILYTMLAIGAIIMAFPFFWMIVSSLKTSAEVNTSPPTFFPANPVFENYTYAFSKAPFLTYFKNSVIVTLACSVFMLLTTILAAFGFSRLKFPGRDLLFSALLALMMVPFEMLIITNYSTIVQWNLLDNMWALILPYTTNILYTYVLRNAFLAIPDSLYYAARVDGASNWMYLWRVMVPIVKPSLITITLLNAIGCWNALLWPVLVTNHESTRTLPFGLYAFMTTSGIRYERLMAASAIVVLPMIIIFICFRKYIVTGISRGGTKG